MRKWPVLAACAVMAGCVQLSAAPPAVQSPKVLTDGYVDTTSIEGIVDYFFKKPAGLSEQQKIIRFYDWYRRAVYPYRYMAADRRDVLKAINTAGFNLCGSQAGVVLVILKAAGYEARVAMANCGPEWGHTFWEVKYDGGWHLFDAMSAFYVFTRDDPPHVAGAAEIMADPTLVSKAIDEKRVAPEFLYSIRKHEMTLEEREQFKQETNGRDVPWSTLVTKPGSLLDFWVAAAERKKISTGKVGDTYNGHYAPGVLDIALKANERYVRYWHGSGQWLTAASFTKYPPQNMSAGGNEAFDPANFRFYEPYRKEKPNPFNDAVYRTYGDGTLEWTPKSAAQLRQGVGELVNVELADAKVGVTVKVVDPDKPASFMIPVKSPYGVVCAVANIDLRNGGVAQLMVPQGNRGNSRWVRAKPVVWDARQDPKEVEPSILRADTSAEISPIYEYAWKIDLPAGSGPCTVFGVLTAFQLNPMVLPGLLPGENTVHVTAAKPGKIEGGKLVVTYAWLAAPDWKKGRSDTKELTGLPADYTIALPDGEGAKLPKMERLDIFLAAE